MFTLFFIWKQVIFYFLNTCFWITWVFGSLDQLIPQATTNCPVHKQWAKLHPRAAAGWNYYLFWIMVMEHMMTMSLRFFARKGIISNHVWKLLFSTHLSNLRTKVWTIFGARVKHNIKIQNCNNFPNLKILKYQSNYNR